MKHLNGIRVVGMTPERAWQIALNTTTLEQQPPNTFDADVERLTREGASAREIATYLGVNERTVARARARARKHQELTNAEMR